MPINYDTLTTSESDDSEHEEERAPSAQALHGTAVHHAAIEHVVAMPDLERPQPVVRIPNLEGTLFVRSALESESPVVGPETEEEDDDEEDEDSEDRSAQSHAAPTPIQDATPAKPPATEQFTWPTVEDTAAAEQPAQDHSEQSQHVAPLEELPDPATSEHIEPLPQPEQPAVASMPPTPAAEHIAWPEDDQDSQPVPQPAAQAASRPQPLPTPPRPTFTTESFNTPPTPDAGVDRQPPLPPPSHRPSESADYNHFAAPRMPAEAPIYDGYNPGAYNQAPPLARAETAPQYDNNRAVDGFARLMGVGNFIGNRRTRKRLGKQIETNRRETAANFADVQAQQLRMNQQQQQQAQALEQMRRSPAEQAVLPKAPFTAEQVPPTPQRPQAPRTEYVTAPTYASQANPTMPSAVRFAERGPVPPLPPIERPHDAAKLTPEQIEQQQQILAEQQMANIPEQRTIRSSWHEAVVDKHGKVIEGAKEYGRGFQQSRREIIRDRAGDAAAVASTAMAGIQQQQGFDPIVQYPGTLPSGITSAALPQGMPTHADPQHQLPSQTKKSGKPGPVFWIMLAVILAAFFAAALI